MSDVHKFQPRAFTCNIFRATNYLLAQAHPQPVQLPACGCRAMLPMSAMERAAFISDAHPDLSRLPATPGPYAVLIPEEYVVQIQDRPHQVKAHAINIFSMDLRRWAIDTDPAHDAEVADIAKTTWSLECARAGKCAFSPIPIAVTDFCPPGGPGSLQK